MSALYDVLQALEEANEPLSLRQLSRQLHIEAGALEGMLMFWVRKGRLRVVQEVACNTSLCGTCPIAAGCLTASRLLRRYEKVQADKTA